MNLDSLKFLIYCIFFILFHSFTLAQNNIDYLLNKTYQSFEKGDYSNSLIAAKKGLKIAIKQNEAKKVVSFVSMQSKNYRAENKIDSAINTLIFGYSYARQFDNKLKINQQIGEILLDLKAFPTAIPYLLEMVKFQKNLEAKFYEMNLLGRGYIGIKDKKKTYETFKEQLKIATKLKNQHLIINAENNIGFSAIQFKDFKTAYSYLHEAEKQFKELQNKENQDSIIYSNIVLNLTICYYQNKQYEQAIQYFSIFQSFEAKLFPKAQNNLKIYKPYINSLLAKERFDEVENLLKKFRSNIFGNKDELTLSKYYLEYYLATNQSKLAKYWSRKESNLLTIVNDSLENENNKTFNILGQFYIKMAEKEIVNERNKLENIQSQKKNLLIIILIISLSCGIIIIGGILFLRENKKRNQIEKLLIKTEKENADISLELKQKDLSKATIDLKERAKIIEEFLKTFRDSEKKESKEVKSLVIEKMKELKQFNASRVTLDQFIEHSNVINTAFHEKLKQKHPNLTQNEIDLCSYLLIGISTKDISNLKGITPHSVRISKSRLKKKMNLNSEDDLDNYLQTI